MKLSTQECLLEIQPCLFSYLDYVGSSSTASVTHTHTSTPNNLVSSVIEGAGFVRFCYVDCAITYVTHTAKMMLSTQKCPFKNQFEHHATF
jgi:hypothetical protein